MNNIDRLIENLQRIVDTDRPIQTPAILTALIQIAGAVKQLQEKVDNNYRAQASGQDTMSL